ncbi:hypothetical protein LLH23_01770 [bacterium]|nr:hypothetical protein [bacterium]
MVGFLGILLGAFSWLAAREANRIADEANALARESNQISRQACDLASKQTALQESVEQRELAQQTVLRLDAIKFEGVRKPLQVTFKPVVQGGSVVRNVQVTLGLLNARTPEAGLARPDGFFSGCWCLQRHLSSSESPFTVAATVNDLSYGIVQFRYRMTWQYGEAATGKCYGEISYLHVSRWAAVRRVAAPVAGRPVPDLSSLVVATSAAKNGYVPVSWIGRQDGQVHTGNARTDSLQRQGLIDNMSSSGQGTVDAGTGYRDVGARFGPGTDEGEAGRLMAGTTVCFDCRVGDWLHLSDNRWVAARCVRYNVGLSKGQMVRPTEGYTLLGKTWWCSVNGLSGAGPAP